MICDACGNAYPSKAEFHSPGLCHACHRDQDPEGAGEDAAALQGPVGSADPRQARRSAYGLITFFVAVIVLGLLGWENVYLVLVNTVLLGAMVAVMYLGIPALLVVALVWIMRRWGK